MSSKAAVSRRFFIDLYGCAKNQVDAEEIATRLEGAGWTRVADADEADLVLVNSCGFIESAKKESIDAVLGHKAARPAARVMLAGCLSQRYPDELGEALSEADAVFGNADLSRVVEAAEAALAGTRPVLAPARVPYRPVERKELFGWKGSAYVKIAEGCSNRCSFCAIPLIRGDIDSRPVGDVVAEIESLLARGVYEIDLIGQDLGSYGRDSGGGQLLPALLSRLSALEGDFRVRMLYIHPDRFPLEILDACERDPRVLPYFDIPFQHGSSKILKAMGRKGDPETYLDLIATIRGRLPEAVVRSTFLVGFPGETDEDFALLREFQDKARLDWLGAFAYSKEEGTAAAAMKGAVPKKLAERRKAELEAAQGPITEERMRRFVGREFEVLIEERIEAASDGASGGPAAGADDAEGTGAEAFSLGRAWFQAPEVDGLCVVRGDFEPGTVVKAKTFALRGVDLEADPVGA